MNSSSHSFHPACGFSIAPAVPEDCASLYGLMRQAASSVPHPDWFSADSLEFIQRHVCECGFILTARAAGYSESCPRPSSSHPRPDSRFPGLSASDSLLSPPPAAFLLVRFPGSEKDNLGRSLNLTPSQLLQVAHMETVVVSKAYIGHGLQRALLCEGERRAAAMGFRYLMATVHPDNLYSLNNFERLGYKKIELAVKYGGLPRWIMGKTVPSSV